MNIIMSSNMTDGLTQGQNLLAQWGRGLERLLTLNTHVTNYSHVAIHWLGYITLFSPAVGSIVRVLDSKI